MVLVGNLLQRIGEVEGKILLLRIEHERELVAAVHQPDEFLMLPLVLFLVGQLVPRHLAVRLGQLVSQDLECLGKVFLGEDSPGPVHGDEQEEQRQQERKYLSILEHNSDVLSTNR